MQNGRRRALALVALLVLSTTLATLSPTAGAESSLDIEVLDTKVNPANNHTYHLLSASSWTEAAQAARGLEGFLVTVDDEAENTWLHETWGNDGNVTRHLWTGLNDAAEEGVFRWHDGTPYIHRQWGEDQPSMTDEEDYVHITGPNMGSIQPGDWNDLENDPQYFPVYGVVELGPGADFVLRFDGEDDHVITADDTSLRAPSTEGELTIEARVYPTDLDGIHTVVMYGDYGYGLYLNDGRLGYSSEYSLSKNALSDANVTLNPDTWSTVAVAVNASTGGTFFLNGEAIGSFDATQAEIPAGDFGSNDCYDAGLACENLVIGRHGAGADRYHFEGMIDHVSISSEDHRITTDNGSIGLDGSENPLSTWTFGEGEGDLTKDNAERNGTIHGAAWVMPDVSVVDQDLELENGDELAIDDVSA
ncbi:MAG: LamG-like jellyroll fold domain-containing protein, partial [Candidatus Thermoplasmatota archaeon]|nr:LamG-like jellyroll fold domain-containing protein [Candidatus Thermoplasmatota archaeon]